MEMGGPELTNGKKRAGKANEKRGRENQCERGGGGEG